MDAAAGAAEGGQVMSYIDREALERKIHTGMTIIQAMQVIMDEPAADVVEVRHGANNGEDYAACDQFVCDQCGVELQGWYRVERDMDDGEETHHEYVMRYCPNCGVKIDGGVNDG